jgi:uncharacterized protein
MAQAELSAASEAILRRFANSPLAARPFAFILVKLASRCNIKCTYCYWFRDAMVYEKPAVLTPEAEDAFCARLEEHIREFSLPFFLLVFHGGEPLLFPKRRFDAFLKKLRAVEERTGCMIKRGITTNGILVDEEWIKLFREHDVSVTVSLDGPAEINDKFRVGFKGEGTLAQTLRGLKMLQSAGLEPGLISVCNPGTDPEAVLEFVVGELGYTHFDILPPDATHADKPPAIDEYFIRLFDVWFDKYAAQGVSIDTLDAMIRGLVGQLSLSDTIGLGPIDTVTLMPDGALEPLDVLRIAGYGSTASKTHVNTNAIKDVQNDPVWHEAYEASTNLNETCQTCEFLDACGGGHLAQRWSTERRFDNPSVYCESWKRILGHMWSRIAPTLTVAVEPAAQAH